MAVSVKLDDEMRERVQALAESKQRSAHWIMREAIRGYVEREESRARFIADAEESYRHYKETGLHLTWDEVEAWMSTWGSDDEQDPPACHT
ncbi:MAG: CopG family ribbon-helix-helix protein [Devosia indica]